MTRVALALSALLLLAGPASAGASVTLHLSLPTGESHTVEAFVEEGAPDLGASVDGVPVQDNLPVDLPRPPRAPSPSVPSGPPDADDVAGLLAELLEEAELILP